MSEGVGYSPGSGTTVAADLVGGDLYQRVKIIVGSDGTNLGDVDVTRPMPVSGTVAVVAGLSVSAQVSGTVSVSGLVGVSGAVSISAMPAITGVVALSGTQVVSVVAGLSVSAQVSGTVSVSGLVGVSGTISVLNVVPVTTQASVSVSGIPVWMNPTQGVTILSTVNVAIVSGVDTVPVTTAAPSISALGQVMRIAGGQSTTVSPVFVSQINFPAVSISVSAALGTVITILGTQIVSVVPGLSVSAVVSGTVTIATGTVTVKDLIPVTTQASVSVSGIPVWMNPTQGVTILGTQLVSVVAGTTVVSGTVSVSGASFTAGTPAGGATGQIVWVVNPGGGAATTTGAPSITQAGTPVWIVGGQGTTANPVWVSQINPPAGGGGSVTVAPPNISATGQIMWIVGGQSTTAFPVVVTGTVTAGAGTTVVSGLVSVTGVSLGVVVSGVVSISVMPAVSGNVGITNVLPVTTQASVSVSGLPVWMNPTQGVTIIGLQSVNTIAAGFSVNALVTGVVSVSAMPAVSGNVGITNIAPVTTQASVSVSGLPVWMNPTQGVTILGTQLVSVVAGTTVVSGTVSVNTLVTILSTVNVAIVAGAGGGGSVTTTAPGITATGQVMWVAGGQSTTVSPVFVSQINPPAGGGGSVTTAVPSVSATGQIMWIVGGQSTTAFPVVVTGTVTAGAGTTVVSLTGSALVSGTVSVLNMVPVTTAASVSVTGWPVWLNPTQAVVVNTIAVGFSVNALVTGVVSVSAMPAVSGNVGITNIVPVTTQASVSVSGLPVWMNPTQGVTIIGLQSVNTIAAGFSVNALVTGVVSVSAMPQVSISGVVPVVTQASVSVGGLPVWMNPTQGVTILGSIAVIQTIVTQLGTQVVTVVPGLSVLASVNGTINVSGIVPVVTQASVSVTGLPVWMNPTQGVTILGTQLVSVVAGTTVVSGTVTVGNALYTSTAVTTGTAQAVWIMNPTTVTVTIAGTTTGTVSLLSIVPVTTQASVSVSGLPVWMNPTQGVTILGTQVVAGTLSLLSIVPVTTQTSVSVTGLPVWFNPGALVAVSSVVPVTTQASVSVSGLPVWFNPGALVAVSNNLYTVGSPIQASTALIVVNKEQPHTPFFLTVTSTVGGSVNTTCLMTVYTGLVLAGAGLTQYAVPAGQVLRIMNMQAVINSSAVTGGFMNIFLGAFSASASWTAAAMPTICPVALGMIVSAGPTQMSLVNLYYDVVGPSTIGVAFTGSTANVIRTVIIQGYLF